MHPPSSPSSMQEVVSSTSGQQQQLQNQHSLMQRLLMGGGSTTAQPSSAARNGIEDIAARLHKQNGNAAASTNSTGNGYFSTDLTASWGDQLSISNNTPMMHLTCLECGINKNNSEDMEVHLKREHLNWLPFQCPICLSERASDAEMREHLHSSHRKNMNKKLPSLERAHTSPVEVPVNSGSGSGSRKRPLDDSLSTGNTNTDALLASISRATSSGVVEGEITEDLELIPMFNSKRIKSEFEADHDQDDGSMIDDSILDNLNPIYFTFRFRCLFEGCTVEHYRKDQMENHQSKIHGKIDPDMMEDRSLELFHRCQELSMELLGTKNGSTPGPTAAKAEAAYNAQIAAQKEKNNKTATAPAPKPPPITAVVPRAVPDEEHPLECRLCHKTMQNRIRGFHILWHMAKDMGINRYICRVCGFGHDRSQSVQVHGKKEHGTEEVVQDRIGNPIHIAKKVQEYSDEVKQMSEKCFGFQALFAQEHKRRSKIPSATPSKSKKSSDDDDTIDDLTLDIDHDMQGELDDADVTPDEGKFLLFQGHQSREIVMRHIRELHDSEDRPVDNRLKHAKDIKAMIRECYPAYFVDAPIPTQQDIEKL
ncbi:zinc finger, C2H2 type [Ostertagia ostertagi]